jgi:chaperonin GroEL
MQKQILTGADARNKIYDGVKKVSDAVVSTLGPRGRNAIISRCFPSERGMQYYMPFVTRDGVTVARNITLTDQIENTGANLIKQASEKTMSDAGDGTTTTCLLMKSILENGIKLVNDGANPQELKKNIDAAVVAVVAELKKMAIPVGEDIEKIRQIATVSANNDSVIGDLIAEAFIKIGVSGDIDIEEAKGVITEIKVADGFKFGRGWVSPYFITNQSKEECELLNPYILLYDKKLTQIATVENILGLVIKENRSILIVCDDADGEALASLAMNASHKKIQCCIVRSPEFGDLKREAMEDLAVVTGAYYISDEKGKSLKSATLKDLGHAAKVVIGKDETVIISGTGDKEGLSDLLNNLRTNLSGKEGEEKTLIERRIARLTGSVAVMYVGAATEVEMKEKKDRVDDAIRATKAAIAEGYVPGGGTAFLRCRKYVDAETGTDGEILVNKVLLEPVSQILKNSGKYTEEFLEAVDKLSGNMGYNAKTEKIEDLIKSGIIDPVKVLRCSLENAASAATMILTSETLIVDTL